MNAIIIAGGKGFRAGIAAVETPNPSVGPAGKTLFEYQIDLLKSQGFENVYISTDFRTQEIRNRLGDGSRYGIKIRYVDYPEIISSEKNAGRDELRESSESLLILEGDLLVNMDMRRLLAFHQNRGAAATLAVHPSDTPEESDLLDVDDSGRIVKWHHKPHQKERGMFYRNLTNAGVYVLERSILRFISSLKNSSSVKDLISPLIKSERIFAYITAEYIKKTETREMLISVERDIISGKFEKKSYLRKQKAIFLDRDGVLNEDTDFVKTPEELNIFPFTAEAVKTINRSDFLAVVVTNQSAVARNLCTEAGLRAIHNKLEWELGIRGAVLDGIYYCPHLPGGIFPQKDISRETDCECRKPKPGMLLKAAEDFNISLADSFMIGDSDRDREAAKRAGVIFAGVRTGKASGDMTADPDYLFENVSEAVQFFVGNPLKPEFDKLFDLFKRSDKTHKPFVIIIGGQARSGKSTLSSFLRINFKKNGLDVLCVRADDWIMPAADRVGTETVLERFRIKKFEKDMLCLFNRDAVSVRKYDSKTRRLREEVVYRYAGQDIVILEGVPLLCSEPLLNLADVALFTRIAEAERKKRFMDFYRWKGLGEAESELLYAERMAEEYEIVELSAKNADIIIDCITTQNGSTKTDH